MNDANSKAERQKDERLEEWQLEVTKQSQAHKFKVDYLPPPKGVVDIVCARFERYVASRPLRRGVIRHPSNWWESVWERWAPGWAKKWRPVVYTEISYGVVEYWPDIVPTEEQRRRGVVRFAMLEDRVLGSTPRLMDFPELLRWARVEHPQRVPDDLLAHRLREIAQEFNVPAREPEPVD